MSSIPPARIASPIDEVETPALLIDLDAYGRNLDRMADSLQGYPVRLRAHAKTHKCPIIANHQVSRGAVGICCQTLGEAEAMVFGGVRNILITNQIVSPGKIRRLAALAKQAEVMACVDDEANLHDLDAAAGAFGVRLPVLVEVNVGQNRCGVEPGAPTLSLAKSVAACRNLRFAGIQAYHGKAQHIYEPGPRAEVVNGVVALVRQTVQPAAVAGPRMRDRGRRGYRHLPDRGGQRGLQRGPVRVLYLHGCRLPEGPGRRPGLRGRPLRPDRGDQPVGGCAVCDAGLKASSLDSGMPVVHDRPGIRYVGAADEHGMLQLDGDIDPLRVGDRLRLIPGHCDPTVNLYDWYVGIRGRTVEALWPITARGANS